MLAPLAACGGGPAGNGAESVVAVTPTPSPTPTPVGRVADEAGLLSPEQKAALSAQLGSLELRTGRQVIVATVTSLHGRDIDAAVAELAGRMGVREGVILMVSLKDREVRLAVQHGSDKLLTQADANRIVNGVMYPDLHANHFDLGIMKGADAIVAQLSETVT